MDVWWFCLCFYVLFIVKVNALMFHLNPNSQKCLKEEIHKDVLVTGEYEVSEATNQKVDLTVSRNYSALLKSVEGPTF